MKVKNFLIISAIVFLVFGIGFLFAPVWSTGLFDITVEPGGAMVVQLLAAAFLGFAALNWFGRNYAAPEDVRSIIFANFFGDTIGFIITLYHRLDGMGNAWTWIPIVLYLLFALAFGYSLLDRKTYEEPVIRPKTA
jgi:hypothetical protein